MRTTNSILALLIVCGCGTMDVEPVARMREGETQVTSPKMIKIEWDKPATGPEPTHYILRADNPFAEIETTNTFVTMVDSLFERRYIVRSVANGLASVDSLPLYVSFAVTGIKTVERNDPDAGTVIVGILVTFATEPGQEYWLDKSTDNGATWQEIGHVLAWDTSQSIGGDASSPHAIYRVWRRL